jgi:hypothetical protein
VATTVFDAATFEIWGPLLNGGVCVIADRSATYDTERQRRSSTGRRGAGTTFSRPWATFCSVARPRTRTPFAAPSSAGPERASSTPMGQRKPPPSPVSSRSTACRPMPGGCPLAGRSGRRRFTCSTPP